MNPAIYWLMNYPAERIKQGDVQLDSIFVQVHAPLIICAVQRGHLHVVSEDGKNYIRFTEEGLKHLGEKKTP